MFKCPTGSIGLYRLHRVSDTPPSIQAANKELPQKLFVISRLVIRVPKEPEEPEKSARRCSNFTDTSSMRRDEVLIYCTGLGVKESSTAWFTRSKISALFMPQRHWPKRGLNWSARGTDPFSWWRLLFLWWAANEEQGFTVVFNSTWTCCPWEKKYGGWAKKFPNTQQISFFCVAVAVVYEKLCKGSIHLIVINCFALARFFLINVQGGCPCGYRWFIILVLTLDRQLVVSILTM